MWNYEKRLQYPVNITTPNPKIAQIIMSQYGGPDGEMGASMRYLSQRFSAPNRTCMAVLTDVGTEELAHLEMVATIVHQLTRNLTPEEISNPDLPAIMWIIQWVFGPRRPEECLLTPVNSSPAETRWPICSKTWLRNRKPEKRMTIFFVS